MTSDIDIRRAARTFIERYGNDAVAEASGRVDKYVKLGAEDAVAIWKLIVAAIERLQAKAPAEEDKVR